VKSFLIFLCSPFDYQAKEKRLFRQAQKYLSFSLICRCSAPPDLAPHAIAPVAGHHRAVPSATLDKGFSIVGGIISPEKQAVKTNSFTVPHFFTKKPGR